MRRRECAADLRRAGTMLPGRYACSRVLRSLFEGGPAIGGTAGDRSIPGDRDVAHAHLTPVLRAAHVRSGTGSVAEWFRPM